MEITVVRPKQGQYLNSQGIAMEVEIPLSTNRICMVSHHNRGLLFNVDEYTKLAEHNEYTFFSINRYFASLPMAHQNKLFDCYYGIHTTLIDGLVNATQAELDTRLLEQINVLVDLLDIPRLVEWRPYNSGQHLPREIESTYSETAPEGPLTYLVPDYKQLLDFLTALRVMVPIWGHYTAIVAQSAGKYHKTLNALTLIRNSALVAMPGYERLTTYIESYISRGKGMKITAVIMESGIDTLSLPDVLLSMAVVKRLCVTELGTHGTPNNLAAELFNYVRGEVETFSKESNHWRHKEAYDIDAENNSSRIESIAQTPAENIGVIAAYDVYAGDPLRLARDLHPGIDPERVMLYVNTLKRVNMFIPTDYQKRIAGLIMESETVVNGIKYGMTLTTAFINLLSRDKAEPYQSFDNVFAVAQAWLELHDLHRLKVLLTCNFLATENESLNLRALQHGSNLLDKYAAQLNEVFPYGLNTNQKAKAPAQISEGNRAIVNIAKRWSLPFESSLPAKYLGKLGFVMVRNNHWQAEYDVIVDELARLLILTK